MDQGTVPCYGESDSGTPVSDYMDINVCDKVV